MATFTGLSAFRPNSLPVSAKADPASAGDGFSGFRVPIRNGKFNFVLNDLGHLSRWSGTVTSTEGSGTESIDQASFDKEGGLQDCGAGSLSWTAKAVTPGSPAAATPSAGYVIKFTKASNGSVHFSVTR